MGAKFIIDRRCSVKTALTLTGLVEALRIQGLVRRVSDLVAAGTLAADSTDTRLEQVLSPENGVPLHMTVGELHQQAAVLKEHRAVCRQCPSSLHGYAGGCVSYVPYPVSEGMEYLLWLTAVRALERQLPPAVQARALAFAEQARQLRQTPFATGIRARGDLLGPAPRVHQSGLFWGKVSLTSDQVLEAFFASGLLTGEDLRVRAGFLTAVLAIARAMEPVMKTEERLLALQEDVEPYSEVNALLAMALEQGMGVYVWP